MTSIPLLGGDAPQPGLIKLGGRPPLRRYLTLLWGRRHFAHELARLRFRAQNEEDRLGIAWTVLGPLINAAVYGLIFGVLLRAGTRPHNFVPYLVSGIFVYQYFSSCFTSGAKAIIGNMGLVRSLHFPRAVLPVSQVLQQLYALAPMMAVLAVLVLIFGEPLRWQWIYAVPALALMTLFNLGIAFIAARLTIHVRDFAQLIPFITRVIFYVSGIFFSVEQTIKGSDIVAETARLVLTYNPVHIYIQLVRHGMLVPGPNEDTYADLTMWSAGVAWAIGALVLGFLYFWRAEERYGRE